MKVLDIIEWILIILALPFYAVFKIWNLFLDTIKTFIMFLIVLALIYNLAFPLFNTNHCTMSNEQYSLLMNKTVIEVKNIANYTARKTVCASMYGMTLIPMNKINVTDLNKVCGGVLSE